MPTLRAVARLIGFLAALTYYATPLWVRAAFGKIDWDHHQRVKQRFCRKAMDILGIRLTVHGKPYEGRSCVYASNHRSWLDPFADMASFWAFPVAKAEVASLPIVAQGAKATGILFVNRGSRESRKAVVDEMVSALKSGFSILIYPEGTTSTLPATKDFHRGGFVVAQDAGSPVVPVAIVYPDPSYHWGEGESLWKNFVQVAGAKRTSVRLFIGEPIEVADANDARERTRAVIDEMILTASS